uniref:Uncharacterized protein n=1 Tax=Arundo donax TaxID=35708 RepID=A0A0A9HGF2_ARUDO
MGIPQMSFGCKQLDATGCLLHFQDCPSISLAMVASWAGPVHHQEMAARICVSHANSLGTGLETVLCGRPSALAHAIPMLQMKFAFA